MTSKWLISLALTVALAGCSGGMAPGGVGPSGGGFIGPDLLANQTFASAVTLPQTNQGLTVAVDNEGKQAAYATSEGVFVGPIGGEARKLAPWNGSVRFLRWTADNSALLLSENEREQTCVQTTTRTTCSSSSADDFARLEKIAVADGTKTLLAEHVYGLSAFTVAPDAVLFAGRIGLDPPPKADANQSSLYRVALTGGSAPEAMLTRPALGAFALSPDGKRVAFVQMIFDGASPAPQVGTLPLDAKEPAMLGPLDGSDAQGPFWNADSTAVRFVRTDNDRELPVQEFPLAGQAQRFAIPRPDGPSGSAAELVNAPDGSRLLAGGTDRTSGTHPLTWLDLDDRTLIPLAPDGRFQHWLGAGPQFLCSVGRSSEQHYYIVRPDAP